MVTPQERLADLKTKLRGREGRPGFKINCEEIRAQIARLEQEIADGL